MLTTLKVVYPDVNHRPLATGRGCNGKIPHKNRAEANKAMLLKNEGYPKGASSYFCRHCGGWHWGRKPEVSKGVWD